MAAADLCTLEDVRQSRLTTATDTAEDGEIAALITRASKAIMRHCEREFAPAGSAGVTRTFEVERGAGFLSLAPYDLQTLTAVQIDTDLTASTLSTDEYRLYPIGKPDGVYTAIRLAPLTVATGRVMWPNRQVQITGTWGFPSVPDDVKHACIATVATWIGQDKSAFSPLLAIDEDGVSRFDRGPVLLGAIPPGARSLLAPYARQAYI